MMNRLRQSAIKVRYKDFQAIPVISLGEFQAEGNKLNQ